MTRKKELTPAEKKQIVKLALGMTTHQIAKIRQRSTHCEENC